MYAALHLISFIARDFNNIKGTKTTFSNNFEHARDQGQSRNSSKNEETTTIKHSKQKQIAPAELPQS